MTHEFSNEPIKLRYIDLKNGEILRNIIFIGNVPDAVERELKKIETSYNKNSIVKHIRFLIKQNTITVFFSFNPTSNI